MVQTELRQTALAVRIWRKSHPAGPTAGMPVDLQRKVVKLLESHSWDEVCEAVGIGRSSLSVLRKRHRDHLSFVGVCHHPNVCPANKSQVANGQTGRHGRSGLRRGAGAG